MEGARDGGNIMKTSWVVLGIRLSFPCCLDLPFPCAPS